MASPCANCVFRGTQYCGIFCGRSRFWFFFFAVLILASSSWGACNSASNWANVLNESQSPCCSSWADCDAKSGSYPCSSSFGVYAGYTGQRNVAKRYQYNNSCPYKFIVQCQYSLSCSNSCEADSLMCSNTENMIWKYTGSSTCGGMQCVENICDSTKWTCTTENETRQDYIESNSITCYGDNCFGTPYCEYKSITRTTCYNECGQVTTGESEVPYRYEGRCNNDNLLQELCSEVRCTSFDGFYHLYKVCASREIINGQQQMLPHFVGGGVGSCANAGYKETPTDSTGGGNNTSKLDTLSKSCVMYGIGCPPKDTTDYNAHNNRTPNNCSCEPLDGLQFISTIVCPDGSRSTFYGSCNEWNSSFSSSSFVSSSSTTDPPESSSSGSENPPASSGGVGDWVTYSQGQEIKGILGVIAQNTAKRPNTSLSVDLDAYIDNSVESDYPLVTRTDSLYQPETIVDTSGIVNVIFNRLSDKNSIIDTITSSSVGVCPCLTFFSGRQNATFNDGHLGFPEMKFDFSNIKGYNLCNIISVIVVALASVVSFFIGFSIFKNTSN